MNAFLKTGIFAAGLIAGLAESVSG